MKCPADIEGFAHAIAAIVQQQGQHDFSSHRFAHEFSHDGRTVSLCGLVIFLDGDTLVRIKAPDMEIVWQAGPDDRPELPAHVFLQGGMIELERWHARLTRFQTVCDTACPPALKDSGRV